MPSPALRQLVRGLRPRGFQHPSPSIAGQADDLDVRAEVALPLAHTELRHLGVGTTAAAVDPRRVGELVDVSVDAGDEVAGWHGDLLAALTGLRLPSSGIPALAVLVDELRLVGAVLQDVLELEDRVADRGEQVASSAAQPLREDPSRDPEVDCLVTESAGCLRSPRCLAELCHLITEVGPHQVEETRLDDDIRTTCPAVVVPLPGVQAVRHHREVGQVDGCSDTGGVEQRRRANRPHLAAVLGRLGLDVGNRVEFREADSYGSETSVGHGSLVGCVAHSLSPFGKSQAGAAAGSLNARLPGAGLTRRLNSGWTSRIEFATTNTRSAGVVTVVSGLIRSGHSTCPLRGALVDERAAVLVRLVVPSVEAL